MLFAVVIPNLLYLIGPCGGFSSYEDRFIMVEQHNNTTHTFD